MLFGFPLSIYNIFKHIMWLWDHCARCVHWNFILQLPRTAAVCEQDRHRALHPFILFVSCPCVDIYVCIWCLLFGFVLSSVKCFYAAVRVMSATWFFFLLFSFEIVLETQCTCLSVRACECECVFQFLLRIHFPYYIFIVMRPLATIHWVVSIQFPWIYLSVCRHPLKSSTLKIMCMNECV